VFRVGDFKSAVEPFLRDNLSDENKLQLNSLLHSVYSNMLKNIGQSRNIGSETVNEIANKMLVQNADEAKQQQLIDDLLYEDEVLDYLRKKTGIEEKEKINFIRYSDYKKSYASSSSRNEIAIIVADGEIMPGKSDQGIVGSETIIKELRRARDSKYVKAVVLRINSPGGSAQASDEMWREIVLTSNEKPIIASMSDYAASGGYYLAMGCDTIVARPTTLTGSIGVFLVIPDLSLFLKNKLGITSEEVKTGEIGNLFTLVRGLTDTEKTILQKQTDEVYETFTSKAADGRDMDQSELKKIASGRVWTGEQAKDNGLVDVLGGFNDAIEIAAKSAGIEKDYRIRYYPKPIGLFEKYFGNREEDVREQEIKEALGGENYILYKQWKEAKKLTGMQMRMPVEFSIN
jgi:protease-4